MNTVQPNATPTADLVEKARAIRRLSLTGIHAATSGHPGGALSVADILAVLYFDILNVRADDPTWVGRDRVVLSKGHSCPALYAALALKGYFPEDECNTLRKISGRMEGHPEPSIPGVDAVSGSLGMGLSQGMGMALGARYSGHGYRAYVILGDGDLQEGNTWEAIMSAPRHKLANLVAIYDSNRIQGDDFVDAQLPIGDLIGRVEAFGWNAVSIDGHDIDALVVALRAAADQTEKPTFIVANTVKGKGVPFMEDVVFWHGSVKMSDEQLADSLAALDAEA